MFYACLTRSKSFCDIPDRSCVEPFVFDDISYFCGLGCRTIVISSQQFTLCHVFLFYDFTRVVLDLHSFSYDKKWLNLSHGTKFDILFSTTAVTYCWKIPNMIPSISTWSVRESARTFSRSILSSGSRSISRSLEWSVHSWTHSWSLSSSSRWHWRLLVNVRTCRLSSLRDVLRRARWFLHSAVSAENQLAKITANTDLEKFEDRIIFMSIVHRSLDWWEEKRRGSVPQHCMRNHAILESIQVGSQMLLRIRQRKSLTSTILRQVEGSIGSRGPERWLTSWGQLHIQHSSVPNDFQKINLQKQMIDQPCISRVRRKTWRSVFVHIGLQPVVRTRSCPSRNYCPEASPRGDVELSINEITHGTQKRLDDFGQPNARQWHNISNAFASIKRSWIHNGSWTPEVRCFSAINSKLWKEDAYLSRMFFTTSRSKFWSDQCVDR